MDRTHLKIAPTLLLYLGAVLAGWSGGGIEAVIPLWLAFLLWHVVMRPAEWPRAPSGWDSLRLLRAGVAASVLFALAAFCVTLGRGLALLVPLPLPVWVGVLAAILATPLQRAFLDPVKVAELDQLLDQTLAAVEASDPGPDDAALAALRDASVQAAKATLASSPPDLKALTALHAPHHLFLALSDLNDEGAFTPSHAQALIAWVCDPANARDLQGQEGPWFAFSMLRDQPEPLADFARACADLLRADPDAFWDCPSNLSLRAAERAHPGSVAVSALRDLRRLQVCLTRDRLARERAEALEWQAESADNPGP